MLWTSQQAKKKLMPMLTRSHNRYQIRSFNIHDMPVELTWMMWVPAACYICKSEIAVEEAMANRITIVCFYQLLSGECLFANGKCHYQPPALDALCIVNVIVLAIVEFHPLGYKEITSAGNLPSVEVQRNAVIGLRHPFPILYFSIVMYYLMQLPPWPDLGYHTIVTTWKSSMLLILTKRVLLNVRILKISVSGIHDVII